MPKFPMLVLWTLVVGGAGFGVGRLTAPIPEQVLAESGFPSIHFPAAATSAADQSLPATVSIADTTTHPSPKPGLPKPATGKRSYAADHKQLQALLTLAQTNPQLAMERAQQFRGAIKARAEAEILAIWAEQDPNAAWNWVASFAPDNKAHYISLLEVIGRSDPRMATSFAEQLVANHRELRKDIYTALITGVAQSGAYEQAARLLSSSALEPATKAELTGSLVADWAAYEPQAAMQWLSSQPGEVDEAALVRLGQSWAEADPQGATQYMATQGGLLRDSLLLPAFNRWLEADPAGAGNWLSASQRDATYDPLINELATAPSLQTQVKTALGWAERMKDHQQRLNTLTSILSATRQKDPSAASAYIRELSYLSDAERAQLVADLALE